MSATSKDVGKEGSKEAGKEAGKDTGKEATSVPFKNVVQANLGNGYNRIMSSALPSHCIEGEIISIDRIRSIDENHYRSMETGSQFDLSFTGSNTFKASGFSAGFDLGANASRKKSEEHLEFSVTLGYAKNYLTFKTPTMSEQSLGLLGQSPSSFFAKYGDSFISEITYGAVWEVTLTFSGVDLEKRRKLSSKIHAATASSILSSTMEGEINSFVKDKSINVSIHVSKKGGRKISGKQNAGDTKAKQEVFTLEGFRKYYSTILQEKADMEKNPDDYVFVPIDSLPNEYSTILSGNYAYNEVLKNISATVGAVIAIKKMIEHCKSELNKRMRLLESCTRNEWVDEARLNMSLLLEKIESINKQMDHACINREVVNKAVEQLKGIVKEMNEAVKQPKLLEAINKRLPDVHVSSTELHTDKNKLNSKSNPRLFSWHPWHHYELELDLSNRPSYQMKLVVEGEYWGILQLAYVDKENKHIKIHQIDVSELKANAEANGTKEVIITIPAAIRKKMIDEQLNFSLLHCKTASREGQGKKFTVGLYLMDSLELISDSSLNCYVDSEKYLASPKAGQRSGSKDAATDSKQDGELSHRPLLLSSDGAKAANGAANGLSLAPSSDVPNKADEAGGKKAMANNGG